MSQPQGYPVSYYDTDHVGRHNPSHRFAACYTLDREFLSMIADGQPERIAVQPHQHHGGSASEYAHQPPIGIMVERKSGIKIVNGRGDLGVGAGL